MTLAAHELLCRCGHGEYQHHEVKVVNFNPTKYSCGFRDERGCCPCLDFSVVPRKRPEMGCVACFAAHNHNLDCDCVCHTKSDRSQEGKAANE